MSAFSSSIIHLSSPLNRNKVEEISPLMENVTRDSERGSSIGEKDQLGSEVLIESVGHESSSQEHGGSSVLARAGRLVDKLGVEQRGIERVLPEERTDTGMSKVGTLWLSANMTVSTFAIGALAQPVFDLGFVDTALTIIFVNVLGILPVCFFSTFGPRFGLRQMVLSRYFFGYYGVKLSKLRGWWFLSHQSHHHYAPGTCLTVFFQSQFSTFYPAWAGHQ